MNIDRFLCRAKDVESGKWVYGAYFKHVLFEDEEQKEKNYLHLIIKSGRRRWTMPRGLDVCVIDPETLGQCTGLRDRNGILIYEGDVVRVEDDNGVCDRKKRIDTGIGTVEWVDGMWYIDGDVSHELYVVDCTRNIKVIGNIHDDQFREVTKKVDGKDGE